MRTRALLLVAALAVPSSPLLAQSTRFSSECPVDITSVTFTRYEQPRPLADPNATTKDKSYGALRFDYRNATDKPIRGFHVTATYSFASGPRPPLWQQPPTNIERYTQADPLAAHDRSNARYEVRLDAGGVVSLRLETVQFQDGTKWKLDANSIPGQCTYVMPAKAVPAGK